MSSFPESLLYEKLDLCMCVCLSRPGEQRAAPGKTPPYSSHNTGRKLGDQEALDYFTLSPPLWASDWIVHSEIFWDMIGTLARFLLQESEGEVMRI